MKTYTLNSDIYDGPEGVALNPNNSNQVKFIRDRMQALFEVLYQAAIQKKAYTIGNDPSDTAKYNKAYAATGKTVEQCIKDNFDFKFIKDHRAEWHLEGETPRIRGKMKAAMENNA